MKLAAETIACTYMEKQEAENFFEQLKSPEENIFASKTVNQ